MQTSRDIQHEANQLDTLKTLVNVYGEVASLRMNRVRESVLSGRYFLQQLYDMFDDVRVSYADQVMSLAKKRKLRGKEKVTFLPHNGQVVAVLLAANTRLYGDLIQRTFRSFADDVKKNKAEAAIVGRVGVQLFVENFPDKPYTQFNLPDEGMDRESMAKIVRHLVSYEEIHVYHGKFINVVRQDPEMLKLSAELPDPTDSKRVRSYYLFEPSLEEILQFFEQEIFGSLFEQTIRESQLAKFAARLVAMDRAEQNIEQRLEAMQLEAFKVKHQTMNRKQLNSMASVLRRF